jgi:hypothetical protein
MPAYLYRDDGGTREPFTARNDDDAEAVTRQMLREGDWGQGQSTKTFRVEANFVRLRRGEPDESTGWTVRHTFEPAEPPCRISPDVTDDEHDWQTEYGVVGGLAENPGVFQSGWGQVSTIWACAKCGAGKTVDLGDTDPVNGENIATTEYRPAGYYKTARGVYWSVVEGGWGGVSAVEPGPAGVDVPAAILEWAAGHGLDADAEPNVYLLVATEDEAGEIPGEIAYCRGFVTYAEDQAIRAQLAAEATS